MALFTVLGMTLGAGLVQLPLIAFGLSSLVYASALAFNLLRWAGATYIVWLGVRLLLSSSAIITDGDIKVLRPTAAAREGMITNLSNPWPLMFMIAFLPQFVDPHRGSVTLQLLVLGAIQKTTGVLVLGTFALASGAIGAWIMRHPRAKLWQQRLAGCFIIGLGVRMVIGGSANR